MPLSNIAKIVEWKTDRGFGFAIANGKKYFVHKSAFGPITRAPKVNDTIIVTQFLETPKGSRISSGTLEGVPLRPMREKREPRRYKRVDPRWLRLKFAFILACFGAIVMLFDECSKRHPKVSTSSDNFVTEESKPEVFHEPFYENSPSDSYSNDYQDDEWQGSSEFRCDGRTHCSQMNSYEEAVFFLQNCPGVKMDGDGDGIPCERQFGR